MSRKIAFANRKGGCGKTTTAINVAHCLAMKQQKVLLLDLDPQAHTTLSLGVLPDPERPNIYHLLDKKASFDHTAIPTRIHNLFLIPSARNLSIVDINAAQFQGDELYLSEVLHRHTDGFDYVIMDPPPSVGPLSVSALVAAKEIYIPMPMQFLAMEGLAEMVRLIYQVNASWNPDVSLCGIIPTFYNRNTRITKEITEDIVRTFGPGKLAPAIRQNVSLAEAPGHGMTVFEYAPKTIGAEDYTRLAEFIGQAVSSGNR